jgi:hypothetical protein
MSNVPRPEPPLVSHQDLPPVRTTTNDRRKATPALEAEAVMLAELESFRADPGDPELEEPSKPLRQRHIPIKRPASDVWVQVAPGWEYQTYVYQPSKSIRDPYVVHPRVVPLLGNKVRVVDLRKAVDSDGVVFFWPSPRGEEFAAHITEREAIQAAERTWIRMQWNPATKAFDYEEAPTGQPLPEPAWPSVDVMTLLGRALEKKKIASADHPIVKALLTPGG